MRAAASLADMIFERRAVSRMRLEFGHGCPHAFSVVSIH